MSYILIKEGDIFGASFNDYFLGQILLVNWLGVEQRSASF